MVPQDNYRNAAFQRALKHVLQHEGEYVDHPRDPGGATKFGITRRTLAKWRNVSPWWQLSKDEVKALQATEVAKIYFKFYWKRVGADLMPEALGFALFDFGVNSGPSRSVKYLQSILNIRTDGIVGPVTIAATNEYCSRRGQSKLIDRFMERRMAFLRSLKTFNVFGKGWSRRVKAVRETSLTIANKYKSIKGIPRMNVLAGYKTYLVALFMLLGGVAELVGVDVPAMDATNAMQMILEALAVIFLRKGIKSEIANA